MTDNIQVLETGLTIHKAVGELTDPVTGRVTGIQQGAGSIAYEGDVLVESQVSPLYLEALDNEDHPLHERVSKKIRRESQDPQLALEARLGLPFGGYDEMDEGSILAVLPNLPSSTVQGIKDYESKHQNRASIVTYNIGYGESAIARQEDHAGGVNDTDSAKAAARLTTREVPEDGGPVQPGEGVTGTGDPQIPHGSVKAAEEEGDDDSKAAAARRGGRRGRRTRQGSDDDKSDSSKGDDSKTDDKS